MAKTKAKENGQASRASTPAPKQIKALSDLQFDPANINKGTERGDQVIDWSLTELGAGRSILVDSEGVTIAGNKTLKGALKHSLPVRVIQTDGKELVVVQRTDLKLRGKGKDRERARQLAIADNRSQVLSYNEDVERLLEHAQSGIDLKAMYSEDELEALLAKLEADALDRQLAEASKTSDGDQDDDEIGGEWQTFSVPVSVSQEQTIRAGLKQAKTKFSTGHSGQALAQLVKEWLDGQDQ